jgi:DNA polymerase III delta prime subunit
MYYPNNFNELIIEKKLRGILETLINIDTINILFVGDSGSGKTSIIRCILNRYFDNNVIDSENGSVLFINNLKDYGIHSFRQEVKTFIQTPSPLKNKKKFVIIDDIDLITEQTQQILRNSIDNYNHKIHFIASCSNIQKVVDNIQSRLNIFKLHNPCNNDLLKLYNYVVEKEDIKLNNSERDFIIKTSNNSYRILLNVLQKIKLINYDKSKETEPELSFMKICTNIKYSDFDLLFDFIYNNDYRNAYKVIYNLYEYGYSIIDIYENLFLYIKITNKVTNNIKLAILGVLTKYINIFHSIHEEDIELGLFIDDLIICYNKNKQTDSGIYF